MPKKIDDDRTHINAGLLSLQSVKGADATYRDMFIKVMGRQPKGQGEINQFTNRVKRGNPGLDFLGKVAKAYPEIRDMSIGEFLGVKP